MNMEKLTWGPKVAPFVCNMSRLCRLLVLVLPACCGTCLHKFIQSLTDHVTMLIISRNHVDSLVYHHHNE